MNVACHQVTSHTLQYRINITLKCTGKKGNKITSKISDSQVSKRKNNGNANGGASNDSSNGEAKESRRQAE